MIMMATPVITMMNTMMACNDDCYASHDLLHEKYEDNGDEDDTIATLYI